MWQSYYAPNSVEEALKLLAKHGAAARLLAGGTDLMIELERGFRVPQTVIDVTSISDLDQISQDEQGNIHLGPLVTHNQVAGSALCRERAFPLVKACWEVGAPQIRNRGTVAGNLATASPANDTISPLWALGATLTLQSQHGSRTLSFDDFFLGVRKTAVAPDEMIVDIAFPAMRDDQAGTFLKLGLRRAQAISVVNVTVILSREAETVTQARITLGSVSPTIVRAPAAEQFLVGQTLTPAVIGKAGKLAAEAAKPIDDVRGTAAYRSYMIETLTRHALELLHKGTEREAVPDKPIMLWGGTNGRFPKSSSVTDEIISTTINGEAKTIVGGNDKSLLRMLREDVGLTGTKEGCAEGECGACTVLIDGIAVMSCLVPAPQVNGRKIITIEGLSQKDTNGENILHPVQQAFITENAVQCGYCTPGFIMSGASLADERDHPTHDEIKQAIAGNLCRCTGYYKIVKALEEATGKGA
ncbi:MAG: 2Fe-2S iron-sulfur cluster binding domain-containing protein [Chloroflexi bacterium]|nr:2Fe-2S iron-sulfur cluster binding domain-containing protein [Chloroflexota bacterium]